MIMYKGIKEHIFICMLAIGLLSSCADEISVNEIHEEKYEIGNKSAKGYISDENGKRMFSVVEFRDSGGISFHLKATMPLTSEATISFTYDESILAEYNKKNGTDYELFPQKATALGNEGIIRLATGDIQSSDMIISYKSDGSLDPSKAYVIPLKITVTSGDIELPVEDQTRLVFVKDLTGLPDCTKYVDGKPGIKVFSCMEVNDTNPLNNLSFTLKSNGKPIVDALIMFSANINYNDQTGEVYIYNNENIQALLDHREKYLKPLQDRGIKIILGLLGNHDRAGIANMSKETAQAFAKKVKAMCDAYQLDGIFVDDEYSDYESGDNITPGFVPPSEEAAARLCYEVKKIQPERWVVAYAYSRTKFLPAIDGMQSGEFVDYGLHDYMNSHVDLSPNYPGMPRSNMGLYSQQFGGLFASLSNLQKMRREGYGANMIFNMNPYNWNFETGQLKALRNMANAFYDDELVFDGIKYPRDWK